MANENIKKVQLSASDTRDIEALHFIASENLDTPAQWKAYIDDLVNKGTSIKGPMANLPAISTVAEQKAAFNNYAGDILLISGSDPESGTYVEYVGITGKVESSTVDNAIVAWEKIGTTTTDLNDYYKKGVTYTGAALGSGTLTTSTPSVSSVAGSGTYKIADTVTGSAGGVTINGSNFSFTGTKANLIKPNGGTTKLDHHKYTPQGSITGSQTISAHSHTVNCATANAVTGLATGGSVTVLTGVKVSASTPVNYDAIKDIGLTPSTTSTDGPVYVQAVSGTFNTDAIKAIGGTKNYGFSASTSRIMTAPTVSNTGVLSWTEVTASTQDAHTGTSATTATVSVTTRYMKHTTTAASTVSVATNVGQNGTADVIKYDGLAKTAFVTSATLDTAGAVTVQGSNFGFSGTAATLKHTQTGTTVTTDYNDLTTSVATTTYEYTPAGTIGGSQTVAAHTHSVGNSNATVSVSVDISAHTHTVGNHTHNIYVALPTA